MVDAVNIDKFQSLRKNLIPEICAAIDGAVADTKVAGLAGEKLRSKNFNFDNIEEILLLVNQN